MPMESPYYERPGLGDKSTVLSKEDSSDESMDDENDFNRDILRFVGNRIGLRLTKKESISTALVLQKTDHELLKPGKVVAQMRKQAAMFTRSPTKEFGLSPLSRTKGRLEPHDDDHETVQTLKSLTERNLASSLLLMDCSKGQAETDKHKTVIWNQSKFRNSVAARVYVELTKDLKNEFFLTFDLGQAVQLTEF